MPTRVVAQGETVPQIAAEEGFGAAADIWDHPNNADLKALRDGCVLAPGDELFIPEKKPKVLSLATGKKHKLVVRRPSLSLKLTLQECFGVPRANVEGTLACEGRKQDVTTDGDGKIEQKVPVIADVARLTLGDEDPITLLVGHLDPLDMLSGWRARLFNLGYPVDFGAADDDDADGDAADGDAEDDDDEAALALAIEEFQFENGLPVTGKRDDATLAKLKEIHGS